MANPLPETYNISVANLPVLQKNRSGLQALAQYFAPYSPVDPLFFGRKDKRSVIEVSELILTASYTAKEQKGPVIQRASVRLDTLKFFLQIGWN